MRILVTGGAGFVASHAVDRLLAAGHTVIVVDDLSTGRAENVAPEAELVRHDIARASTVDLVARLRPEVVVHAAAQVSVSASVEDPAHDARSNVLGTLQVALGAAAAGASQVVYVTTGGALYGEPRYLPCDEDHPIEPISPYGLSKWVGERYLALVAPGLRRAVLRLANVYGPRQSAAGEAGVVAIFASRMLAGGPVEIHGDGGQTRDFVDVGDVAAAIELAVARRAHATVNIGTGAATSVSELFRQLAAATGYTREAVAAPARPGDVRDSVMDVRRAREVLGWEAVTPLDAGLRRTVEWCRAGAAR